MIQVGSGMASRHESTLAGSTTATIPIPQFRIWFASVNPMPASSMRNVKSGGVGQDAKSMSAPSPSGRRGKVVDQTSARDVGQGVDDVRVQRSSDDGFVVAMHGEQRLAKADAVSARNCFGERLSPTTLRARLYPFVCRPELAIPISTCPAAIPGRGRSLALSTTPTSVPATSTAPSISTPGISAVSPPSNTQLLSRHAAPFRRRCVRRSRGQVVRTPPCRGRTGV